MKHVSTYKLFESSDNNPEIISNIKDILLELSDEGYTTIILTPTKLANKVIGISIRKLSPFKLSDISEVIYRIEDYLGEEYKADVGVVTSVPIFNQETFELADKEIWNIEIYFNKYGFVTTPSLKK